ncbi:MAG: nucleotide sugar dehydrogenase, partial [Candidatus Omnitrophica bacterium]|nr:nucleotide sugar dehydrogenase [Candidatus Omnitrophota bacterium]
GVTPACTKLAAAFYGLAIEHVHPVSSTSSAEMVKLLENTFRSVNIGLVNELCQMSQKLGVDVWEIIDAAATKPFGFMPFYPGPGLGGHCIPIDPHYLAWKARINGFNPRFIDLAGVVNAEMPEYVVRKAQDVLNKRSKALKGSRILIFGVTYKKNISDVRESPALEIIELLEKQGAEVSYTDPFVPELTLHGKTYRGRLVDTAKGRMGDAAQDRIAESPRHRVSVSEQYDLAVIVTDHAAFDKDAILASAPVVLDTRNVFRGVKNEKIVRI